MLTVEETPLEGVLRITPRRFGDARGFFCETWNSETFARAGLRMRFVQDNLSRSEQAGTLRGLHYQAPRAAQGKLIRCARGAVFDVALDLRRGSAQYGQWTGADLTEENGAMLWVPEGFAHGFLTRRPGSEVVYKCTHVYDPTAEGAVHWDSAGIDWGWDGPVITSDKDAAAPRLSEVQTPFVMADA